MNFMYLVRLSTSSVMKLVVEDDVVEETLYGQTSMTSSFSIVPLSSFCYSARMWTDFRVRVSGQE